jgi:hypothetical protein
MIVPFRRPSGPRAARLVLAAVAASAGCDRGPEMSLPTPAGATKPAEAPASPALPSTPRPGISELEPGATLPTAAGQQIYLPIHGRISGEEGRPIRLAVNVAVRNTDETRPILVTLLRHRDADGKTVRDYLRAPARLAPKATLDVLLKDTDAGAPAASVLVEWAADRPVAPPIVESIMIGTVGSPGISFIEHGQVLEDHLRPAVPPR